MRYFVKLTATFKPTKGRESLHQELERIAESWDQKILEKDEIREMIGELQLEIREVHKVYQESKPFDLSFYYPTQNEDKHLTIHVMGVFVLSIFKEKVAA